LIAAGEGFVEKPGHRAAGPILIEDLLGHTTPSVGGVDEFFPSPSDEKYALCDRLGTLVRF
jgi:hypothetical protein